MAAEVGLGAAGGGEHVVGRGAGVVPGQGAVVPGAVEGVRLVERGLGRDRGSGDGDRLVGVGHQAGTLRRDRRPSREVGALAARGDGGHRDQGSCGQRGGGHRIGSRVVGVDGADPGQAGGAGTRGERAVAGDGAGHVDLDLATGAGGVAVDLARAETVDVRGVLVGVGAAGAAELDGLGVVVVVVRAPPDGVLDGLLIGLERGLIANRGVGDQDVLGTVDVGEGVAVVDVVVAPQDHAVLVAADVGAVESDADPVVDEGVATGVVVLVPDGVVGLDTGQGVVGEVVALGVVLDDDASAVAGLAGGRVAVEGGSDPVAEHQVAGGLVGEVDAAAVAADHVVLVGPVPPDEVAPGPPLDVDADAVAHVPGAVGAESDDVVLDPVLAGLTVVDPDAEAAVARDDVAVGQGRGADAVLVRAQVHGHAGGASGGVAGCGVGADEVADDQVAIGSLTPEFDLLGGPEEGQAPDRVLGRLDGQDQALAHTPDLDPEVGVGAVGVGVGRSPGLGVAIDDDAPGRVVDRRQGRADVDPPHPAAGDGELDAVGAPVVVGLGDGGPEGADAGPGGAHPVGTVGVTTIAGAVDHEGRVVGLDRAGRVTAGLGRNRTAENREQRRHHQEGRSHGSTASWCAMDSADRARLHRDVVLVVGERIALVRQATKTIHIHGDALDLDPPPWVGSPSHSSGSVSTGLQNRSCPCSV